MSDGEERVGERALVAPYSPRLHYAVEFGDRTVGVCLGLEPQRRVLTRSWGVICTDEAFGVRNVDRVLGTEEDDL